MSSEATPSRRRQTALAVIDAYNKWSMDAIMAVRTDDCIQQILPKSLGRPEMDNTAYAAYFSAVIPYFEGFTVTINELLEDAQENKVVLWANSTATTPVGPYNNEYMLVFYMNEAGDKITKFIEFVDSAHSVTFFPKLREYIAQKTSAEAK
ncbi:hypothetical protein HD806DRAFT_512762 [Xylariaceae sp. AK1471]|nr:hypothetical protein HD806DRAFT_512762 [Xylariaceae sp. AK1471]